MKFDILGIGNALVDETFYVERDFVDSVGLNFNSFKPFSYKEQEKIISSIPEKQSPEIMCGGSTTNSLAAASNLGSKCGLICQLGDDERGVVYEKNLKDNGIEPLNNFHHKDIKTGRCLVFITPNSERTMGTFLGASERLIDDSKFIAYANNSKIIFSEGYQFTSDENYLAFLNILKGCSTDIKFALSLSDPGVVNAFRKRFEEVINIRNIDYLFCNQEEAIALTGSNFAEDLQKVAKNYVVTNGSNNSIIQENNSLHEIGAYKVEAIDSNGAGDIFAGAALYKVIKGDSFFEACKFGNYASSIIVQEKSPRLTKEGYKSLADNYKKSL
ncbi:MAG: adenosine kinase [Gammaproteobacteria bacterium]|nr:adenosine kinase [Gammaproteobacteria bacterium]|tara:strand:- start:4608 stop:5594 length:987 start_codon:yes stop_codon:yes gene_type:complete